MLAKKQSSNWTYFNYLMIVPVTSILILLFSFNLAEDLPDTLVDPLARVEQSIHDLAAQPVLPKTIAAPEATVKKRYSLKWGDVQCDCQSEQFPNYYHCENQSFLPGELRRLIRKEGGFQLYLDENPQTIRDLKAISKHMKDMGGFQGQFDEMDQRFNVDSPLWSQAEKGDVFLFSFNNGQGDYFEFEVIVNNRKEDYIYGSRVELGDFHFNINLTNEVGVVHLDVEEFQDLVRNPLKIRKNRDTYYQLSSLEITNGLALRQESWKDINSIQLDLSRSMPILEAYPGDRINIKVQLEEEGDMEFDVLLRKNSAWDGRQRDHMIHWGDLTFKPYEMKILSREELEPLLDEIMYLYANGRKHPMEDKRLDMHNFKQVNNQIQRNDISVVGFKEYVKKVVPDYKPGEHLYARDVQQINGYMVPPFNILVDFNWKEVFPDRADISVSEKGNVLTINQAKPEDLDKIMDLDKFSSRFYRFEVDGKEYLGYNFPKEEFRKLILQGLPQKKLVIGRVECFACLVRKENR